MNNTQAKAVQKVVADARALIAALRKASPRDNPGAEIVADLIERDVAHLLKTAKGTDEMAIRLALVFASLDARAADDAGGVDFDGDPTINPPYRSLIESRIAARSLFG